uniref:Uncharacterized protein n=1 Tax=Arundo donax TaxID=35708 RepID=A0A0A9GAF4_ARUDO
MVTTTGVPRRTSLPHGYGSPRPGAIAAKNPRHEQHSQTPTPLTLSSTASSHRGALPPPPTRCCSRSRRSIFGIKNRLPPRGNAECSCASANRRGCPAAFRARRELNS